MNVPRKYMKSSVLAAAAVVGIFALPRLAAAEETLTFVWHAGTCADAIVEIAKDYPDKNVKIVPALVPYGPRVAQQDRLRIRDQGRWLRLCDVGQPVDGGIRRRRPCHFGQRHLRQVRGAEAGTLRSGLARRATANTPTAPASTGACRSTRTPMASCTARTSSRIPRRRKPSRRSTARTSHRRRPIRMPRTSPSSSPGPTRDLYGWGQMGGRDYDFATTASNSFLWSFGGELYNPETNRGEGLPQLAGLGRRRPGLCRHVQVWPSRQRQLGLGRGQRGLPAGQARDGHAVVLFQRLKRRSEGEQVRRSRPASATCRALSGATASSAASSASAARAWASTPTPRRSDTLVKFMEWYFQPEQQKRYAAVCQTGLKSVLDSPEWQNLNSYNKHFAKALAYTNDYWHLPEYAGAARPVAGRSLERDLRQEDRPAGARRRGRTQRADAPGAPATRSSVAKPRRRFPTQVVAPVGKDAVDAAARSTDRA